VSNAAPIVLGMCAMLGYGVEDVIAKAMLTKRNAIRIAVVSQAMGSLLFLGVAITYDLALPSLAVIYLTLISGVVSAVVLCSFYFALSLGKVSIASPILSCMNAVAVTLSLCILGESLTRLQLSLIVLVFVGILLVAFEKSETQASTRKLSVLLALLAAVLGGGNIIVQKWMAETSHYLMAFFLTRVFEIALMAPLSLSIQKSDSVTTFRNYVALGVLGLIDVSAFFCWYIGLRLGLVSIVTPIVLSSPAVTLILAHIFLKEQVQIHQRVGIVAVVAGVALLSMIS